LLCRYGVLWTVHYRLVSVAVRSGRPRLSATPWASRLESRWRGRGSRLLYWAKCVSAALGSPARAHVHASPALQHLSTPAHSSNSGTARLGFRPPPRGAREGKASQEGEGWIDTNTPGLAGNGPRMTQKAIAWNHTVGCPPTETETETQHSGRTVLVSSPQGFPLSMCAVIYMEGTPQADIYRSSLRVVQTGVAQTAVETTAFIYHLCPYFVCATEVLVRYIYALHTRQETPQIRAARSISHA